jgi:predicted MFS family arabinose efflux permease
MNRSLLLLMTGIAGVGIQALMISPLLTDIAPGLGVGPKELGFASAAYGVGVAAAALLAAPRLGQWPKRRALSLSFALMTAALILCAVAWDWRVLTLGQFITGLAAGVIIPGTYAYAGDLAEPSQRSQALGKVLFGWSVAMVAGVPLAALLSEFAGWRGTFALVAAIAAAMALSMRLLPRVGASASQARVAYRDVLALPGAPIGYIATFAYMIAFYQTYTFIGDHVRLLHGTGAWLGGMIALSYGVGFGVAVLFDKWIDAKGPRRVLPLGLLLVGLNYAILPAATFSILTTTIYPFFWGVANHFCMTALVAFLGSLAAEKRGTIMGLFSFVTYVAVGAGGAIYGSVYDAYGFLPVSWAAAAGVVLAAILIFALRPRTVAA